ncbi:amidohydrolase, partial [Francisella tularensis subsp. holarctica]|nr:amidohydrolase [Francisella tularensis subsp. holarctica]
IDYQGDRLAHQEIKPATLSATLDKEKQLQQRSMFNFLASQEKFTLHF